MPKILEDSLGNLEYLMLGLILVGVLYLVMKQAKLSVNLSKDDFRGNHGIRFLTEDDAGNRAGYYPSDKGYEDPDVDPPKRQGMSIGAYEAPAWHASAHDSSELDMIAYEKASAGVDYNQIGDKRMIVKDLKTEGMGGYARKAVESMDSKLNAAMLGDGRSLQ